MCVRCLQRREEVAGPRGTGATEYCEPACGCQEPNLSPLQEQPVLVATEPTLLPWKVELLGVLSQGLLEG